jgi:hypothetical protein
MACETMKRIEGILEDTPEHLGASQFLRGRHILLSFCNYGALINTPLQRGGTAAEGHWSRFSGFSDLGSLRNVGETAEAVDHLS